MIFDRAPVGLAFHDLDGRYVRINDHLAEINGRPPAEHVGRTLAEILPELPEVGGDVRARRRDGPALHRLEVRGETPARAGGRSASGSRRTGPCARRPAATLIGVGAVVFDVTDRRAAERALRTQTDRYETLLEALSEVGEGMVVLEDGRCVYANHAFEQLSGYTFPELTALESLFDLVDPDERAEAERRARLRTEHDLVDTTYTVAIRRRDGGRVMLELAGVPLEIAGRRSAASSSWSCATSPRAAAPRTSASGCWRAPPCWPRRARCSTSRSTRSARCAASRELCVRDLADTCVVVLGGYPGPARRTIAVARDPERERALAAEPVLDGRRRRPGARSCGRGAAERRTARAWSSR